MKFDVMADVLNQKRRCNMNLLKNLKFVVPLILLFVTISCFKDAFQTTTEPELEQEADIQKEEESKVEDTAVVDTCTKIKDDSAQLMAESKNCASDVDCKLINMYEYITNSCLGTFQCSAAIRKDTDMSALKSKMEELAAQFKTANCQPCAMASCAAIRSDQVACNTSTGKCEIKL